MSSHSCNNSSIGWSTGMSFYSFRNRALHEMEHRYVIQQLCKQMHSMEHSYVIPQLHE